MADTIYVLNGPTLTLLGTRQPETYGHTTLADVEQLCREAGKRLPLWGGLPQSNHQSATVAWVQEAARGKAPGVGVKPPRHHPAPGANLDATLAAQDPQAAGG